MASKILPIPNNYVPMTMFKRTCCNENDKKNLFFLFDYSVTRTFLLHLTRNPKLNE